MGNERDLFPQGKEKMTYLQVTMRNKNDLLELNLLSSAVVPVQHMDIKNIERKSQGLAIKCVNISFCTYHPCVLLTYLKRG